LAVTLDLAEGAGPGLVGILAELGAGAALAEEVPALVELLLEGVQPGLLVGGEAVPDGPGAQRVLLGDQLVDPADDLAVVHDLSFGWSVSLRLDASTRMGGEE
jgi:hypothetical protein